MIKYLGIFIFTVGFYSLFKKKLVIKRGGVSKTKSWLCVLGMILGFILVFGSNFHANITVGDKEIYSVGDNSEEVMNNTEEIDDSVCGGVIEEPYGEVSNGSNDEISNGEVSNGSNDEISNSEASDGKESYGEESYGEDSNGAVSDGEESGSDDSLVDSTSNQSVTFHTMDGTPITIHPSSDFKVTSAEYCTILSSDKLEAVYTESCLYNEDSTIEDILSEYNKVYHIDLKKEECNGKAVYMGSYMTDYDAHKLIVVQDTGEGHLIQIDITDYDKAIDDIDLFNMFGLNF